MTLHLQAGTQIGSYHFVGMLKLQELSLLLKDYPFGEEVREKAAIHRRNMEQGIAPFEVTLRLDPGTAFEVGEDEIRFEAGELEIRDGKSKAAAVLSLEEEKRTGAIRAHIFLTTKEQMDKLEQNQL